MRTPSQAVAAARATKHNVPESCQFTTRIWLDAPSAGDFDGDGAADAEDGWKKEPVTARRFDKRGIPGYPAAFLGGSHDNGHRALFVEPNILRSTDFNGVTKRYDPGVVGEGTVDEVADAMNVTWAGYSLTMDGIRIPPDKKPKPLTKGWRVERAERLIKHSKSKPGSARSKILKQIADLLVKVPKQ